MNFTSHFITQGPVNRLVSLQRGQSVKNSADDYGLKMHAIVALNLRCCTGQTVFDQLLNFIAIHTGFTKSLLNTGDREITGFSRDLETLLPGCVSGLVEQVLDPEQSGKGQHLGGDVQDFNSAILPPAQPDPFNQQGQTGTVHAVDSGQIDRPGHGNGVPKTIL